MNRAALVSCLLLGCAPAVTPDADSDDAGHDPHDGGSTTPDAGSPHTGSFRGEPDSWTLPAGGWIDQGFVRTSGSGVEEGDDEWSLTDLDGDGRPDLVVTAQVGAVFAVPGNGSNPHWKFFRNTGQGFASTAATWAIPAGGFGGQGFVRTSGEPAGRGDDAWSLIDMDGDARPDLVVTTHWDTGGATVFGHGSNPHWRVFRNTGSGFATTATTWPVPAGGWINQGFVLTTGRASDAGDDEWSLLDLTGDGKPELVVTAHATDTLEVHVRTGDAHWRVFTNNGAGFATTATEWPVPDGGWIDMGFVRPWGQAIDSGDDEWSLVDLDGDARADLVVTSRATTVQHVFDRTTDPHWRLFRNTGSGFAASFARFPVPAGGFGDEGFIRTTSDPVESGDEAWALVDLDADAKPDLVVTSLWTDDARTDGYPDDPRWRVYRNGGAAFSRTATTLGLPSGGWVGQGFARTHGIGTSSGDETRNLLDLDGDRVPELVVTARHDGTRSYPFDSRRAWRVFRKR